MLQVYDVCDRFKNEKIPPKEVDTVGVLYHRTSHHSSLRILKVLLFPLDGGKIVILMRFVVIIGFFTSSRNNKRYQL